MMNEPADLELQLHRKASRRYGVELVFNSPASRAPIKPLGDREVTVKIDHAQLRAAALSSADYGTLLGQMLFGDSLAAGFAQCRAVAEQQSRPLRVRLLIGAGAPELHAVRWETLRVPGDSMPLALSPELRFSRQLGSADWKPVALRPRATLRALIVVAAPSDLDLARFGPIDVAGERARATSGLAGARTTVLAAPGHASLAALRATLRDGYDIVYLIAHGIIVDDEPWVFLETSDGKADRVAASSLAFEFRGLAVRPQLVFLASCQSGGDGSIDALVALGPRLVTEGIPAVVAMQGNLTQATNAGFAETFFTELGADGRLDRALASARQAIARRDDWWMPALFTRLRGDRIWYEPGFEPGAFEQWPALLNNIKQRRCTPILGPGLLDVYVGSTRQLAQQLADRHGFPLADYARDNLPQVTQYLAVKQDAAFMLDELSAAFRKSLAQAIAIDEVPPNQSSIYLASAGDERRQSDPDEPHRILARLQLPIYLTANPDTLLVDALRKEGSEPQVLLCPWYLGELAEMVTVETPTPEKPLVYYLFGHLDERESLVVTEDDYFRYLTWIARNQDLLPKPIERALASTALLFLGFGLEDWNFRVLFESLVSLYHSQLRSRYIHVAVQVSPQEQRLIDPQAAREYLKKYFGAQAAKTYQTEFSIYWGSAGDFARDLARHDPEPRSSQ